MQTSLPDPIEMSTEGDPVVPLWRAVELEARLKKIHQTLDSVSLCRPVTKYCVEVDSPAAVAEVMENAFRAAEEERPGAVSVSLPSEVMAAAAMCGPVDPAKYAESFGATGFMIQSPEEIAPVMKRAMDASGQWS